MTYAARKGIVCTYPGCTAEPLEDNNQCALHRNQHRERNRRWKRWAALRQVIQLRLL